MFSERLPSFHRLALGERLLRGDRGHALWSVLTHRCYGANRLGKGFRRRLPLATGVVCVT